MCTQCQGCSAHRLLPQLPLCTPQNRPPRVFFIASIIVCSIVVVSAKWCLCCTWTHLFERQYQQHWASATCLHIPKQRSKLHCRISCCTIEACHCALATRGCALRQQHSSEPMTRGMHNPAHICSSKMRLLRHTEDCWKLAEQCCRDLLPSAHCATTAANKKATRDDR